MSFDLGMTNKSDAPRTPKISHLSPLLPASVPHTTTCNGNLSTRLFSPRPYTSTCNGLLINSTGRALIYSPLSTGSPSRYLYHFAPSLLLLDMIISSVLDLCEYALTIMVHEGSTFYKCDHPWILHASCRKLRVVLVTQNCNYQFLF